MAGNPNPLASATKTIIRASPPLKSITKTSSSLARASLSNRHYARALLSLLATRNLIKSFILFRPVNRRTLKPGSPLWKMLLKAVWLAIFPALSQSLLKGLVKNSVASGTKVETCEGVSAPRDDVVVGLIEGSEDVKEVEAQQIKEAEELAFMAEFAAAEQLAMSESPTFAFIGAAG